MNFTTIYNTYYKRYVYFADKILKDREQAKDIVQECLVKLWDGFGGFPNESAVKSFLYVSVRNACLNYLKEKTRLRNKEQYYHYLSDEGQQDIRNYFHWAEILQEITISIEKLPTAESKIFKMIFFEDMTTDKIATLTGLSVQTIRNQKSNAVNKLRLRFAR